MCLHTRCLVIFRWEVREDQDCDSSTAKRLPCAQIRQSASLQPLQGAFPQPCGATLHPGVTSGLMSLSTSHCSCTVHSTYLETAAQITVIILSHCLKSDKLQEYKWWKKQQPDTINDLTCIIYSLYHKQKISSLNTVFWQHRVHDYS